MDERVVQFRVGAMVLAVGLIALILVALFHEFPGMGGGGSYKLYVDFARAPGVTPATPVRKNGILIGRVIDVELRDEGVLVTTEIDRRVGTSEVNLRANEDCQITGSLLGDKSLEFVPSGDEDRPKTILKNGDQVHGIVSTDPLEVVANLEQNLGMAMRDVTKTTNEIGKLARRMSDLLQNNEEQISRVVRNADLALDGMRRLVDDVNSVVGDEETRENLKRSIAGVPRVLEEMEDSIGTFKTTLESVDRNLQNFEGLTKPLGERGDKLIGNIEGATEKLDLVLDELLTFSQRVNDSEGALGKLLSDPELYDEVLDTVKTVKRLTRKIEPILEDARVFTDDLARNRIRGQLQKKSPLK